MKMGELLTHRHSDHGDHDVGGDAGNVDVYVDVDVDVDVDVV